MRKPALHTNTGSESVCIFTMGEVWKYSSHNSWALGYTISVLTAFSAVSHSLFNVPVSSAFCVIHVSIERKSEVSGGQLLCLRSHSWSVKDSGFEP